MLKLELWSLRFIGVRFREGLSVFFCFGTHLQIKRLGQTRKLHEGWHFSCWRCRRNTWSHPRSTHSPLALRTQRQSCGELPHHSLTTTLRHLHASLSFQFCPCPLTHSLVSTHNKNNNPREQNTGLDVLSENFESSCKQHMQTC